MDDDQDAVDLAPPTMPWDRRPALYEFVREQVAKHGVRLDYAGEPLPDEARGSKRSGIRWSGGALDGLLGVNAESDKTQQLIKQTVAALVEYIQQPTAQNKLTLYQLLLGSRTLSIVDGVLEALREYDDLPWGRLLDLAHSLAVDAPDREPVKFGIAVLGRFQRPEDEPLLQTLGRHSKFTLYCAVALSNAREDNAESLWELAQHVRGWGRIHTVRRLADTDTTPAIRDWLLREGFRRTVMDVYLAAICARAGGLLEALSGDGVDRELLDAAGDLLGALIVGGPAEDIDDYDDARPVIEHYLRHIGPRAASTNDFLRVTRIARFLSDDDDRWTARYTAGWDEESRERLRVECNAVLNHPHWRPQVVAELDSHDETVFWNASLAATWLGVDARDAHWRRLREQPNESRRWYPLCEGADESQMDELLAFAELNLDVASIASGPADELGLGRGFEPHSCLDHILYELRRFPGKGEALIATGLQSPVVRNRNLALAALALHPRDAWSERLVRTMTQAAACEPLDDVRACMEALLRGEPLPK